MLEYVAGGAATACESQKVPGVAGISTGVVALCQVRVRASTVGIV